MLLWSVVICGFMVSPGRFICGFMVSPDRFICGFMVSPDRFICGLWSLCCRLLAEGGRHGNKLAVVLCRSGFVSPYSKLRAAKGSAGHASVLPKAASRTQLTNTHDKRRIMHCTPRSFIAGSLPLPLIVRLALQQSVQCDANEPVQ